MGTDWIRKNALPEDRKFFIRKTSHGSDRYGNCEVCEKHVSETWAVRYQLDDCELPFSFYGHKECLLKLNSKKIFELINLCEDNYKKLTGVMK